MVKTHLPYPAEFRQQIVELAQAGRTAAELSREFGPSDQTIHNWLAQAVRADGKPRSVQDTLSRSEREELLCLRRECRQLKIERDILAKATAWFAARRDANSVSSSRS
jgi:transposase